MKNLLKKYAHLVIKMGVNLQPDQLLVINAPLECADFARLLAEEAYTIGAHDVIVNWKDEKLAKLRYTMGKESIFSEFPEWRRLFYMDYAQQGAAFISIYAEDPEIFKEVAPDRLAMSQRAAGAALIEYRQRMMNNENAWCVVSIPTIAWAKKVFPDVSVEMSVKRLWQEIFKVVRIDKTSDPVENWKKHVGFLAKAADFMNAHQFVSLHYCNSVGTNLTVELPKGHIWAGGAEYTTNRVLFVANMPTEEVYSLPKRDGVNGTVVGTKPFSYNGNLIEGFQLTFKDGVVVDYKADKGQDILGQLIKTDEGSCRLGEVALVPYDSPISQSGTLFFNTLFDENASCHLALGKAYPTCLTGSEKMTSIELAAAGVNDSLVHEDFMIGSADLEIIGTTEAGRKITVFEKGNFVKF